MQETAAKKRLQRMCRRAGVRFKRSKAHQDREAYGAWVITAHGHVADTALNHDADPDRAWSYAQVLAEYGDAFAARVNRRCPLCKANFGGPHSIDTGQIHVCVIHHGNEPYEAHISVPYVEAPPNGDTTPADRWSLWRPDTDNWTWKRPRRWWRSPFPNPEDPGKSAPACEACRTRLKWAKDVRREWKALKVSPRGTPLNLDPKPRSSEVVGGRRTGRVSRSGQGPQELLHEWDDINESDRVDGGMAIQLSWESFVDENDEEIPGTGRRSMRVARATLRVEGFIRSLSEPAPGTIGPSDPRGPSPCQKHSSGILCKAWQNLERDGRGGFIPPAEVKRPRRGAAEDDDTLLLDKEVVEQVSDLFREPARKAPRIEGRVERPGELEWAEYLAHVDVTDDRRPRERLPPLGQVRAWEAWEAWHKRPREWQDWRAGLRELFVEAGTPYAPDPENIDPDDYPSPPWSCYPKVT